MLVCNVSLRPPRPSIAADLAEAATAVDATATGNVVFATLVDDPASVGEIVDAYLGEIMLEAASAADSLSAGSAFDGVIVEAAISVDTQDATIPAVLSTWNPGDHSANMTLSNGNLTATSTNFNVGVRAGTSHSSGKYYWEITMANGASTADDTGLATAGAALGSTLAAGIAGVLSGSVYVNTSFVSAFPSIANGNIIGIAADLTARLIWFRITPSGNWNNSGTADPATGTGGFSISALAGSLFPVFEIGAAVGHNATANFGASAFNGSVPSGFTSGW